MSRERIQLIIEEDEARFFFTESILNLLNECELNIESIRHFAFKYGDDPTLSLENLAELYKSVKKAHKHLKKYIKFEEKIGD